MKKKKTTKYVTVKGKDKKHSKAVEHLLNYYFEKSKDDVMEDVQRRVLRRVLGIDPLKAGLK